MRPRKTSASACLPAGNSHYRAYVGPPEDYDLIAAMTFSLLAALGLRQYHRVLDIGCGSLRIGRLLIPYLNCGHYTGIEPNEWLIKEGIRNEIGRDQIEIKRPCFHISESTQALPSGAVFDFALAQSIFSHCGADLLRLWLADISLRLGESGALVASFLARDIDSHEKGWVYPDCASYRVATMQRLGQEAGFRFLLLDWAHPRLQWALLAKPECETNWFEVHGLSWNSWLRTMWSPSAPLRADAERPAHDKD